jgi:hypothetical protein
VAPHENLRDPAGSQRSFPVRFRFDQIFAPNNYDLPEALNLGPRELQSNELSTFLLKGQWPIEILRPESSIYPPLR